MQAEGEPNVDLATYLAAFERYCSCVEAAGGKTGDIQSDPVTGQYTWSVIAPDGETAAAVENCYDGFREVDEGYALATAPSRRNSTIAGDVEQIDHFRRHVAPCLVENGVEFEVPVSVSSSEWERLNRIFLALVRDGKCSAITPQD